MSRWKQGGLARCAPTSPPPATATPPPRASPRFEILSSWAGVQALLAHRAAHALLEAGVPLLPRAIAYVTRAVTGVEIHPAAVIGRSSSSTTAPAW